MKQKPAYTTKEYNYSTKSGNLNAEAVGVVKGEKHFPVFEGKLVFKPLTKSKPFSGPLFAYAEVFWSWSILVFRWELFAAPFFCCSVFSIP